MILGCSLCPPRAQALPWALPVPVEGWHRAQSGISAGHCPSQTMKAHGVRNIVFSSSATVYGDPKYLPLDEKHPVGGCTNPYGKSKFFIEEMIQDLCRAERVRSRPTGLELAVSPGR